MTAEELIAFERDIADEFNAGNIRAPIHLAGGNEAQLIKILEYVRPIDWVLCQWRSHYHCLLKGVPPQVLRRDIIAGKSIALCYPEHRILCSAIVGGILPIAVGLAWSIQRRGETARVWAFFGDMTARTGVHNECIRYALGHNLPISFIEEDNGVSVCTSTESVWFSDQAERSSRRHRPNFQTYKYKLPWPHAGAGKRVQF